MAINGTVKKLRAELTLALEQVKAVAKRNEILFNETVELSSAKRQLKEQVEKLNYENDALRAKANEVISFNDNVMAENKELVETLSKTVEGYNSQSETIKSLTIQFNNCQEDLKQSHGNYTRACREFGNKMYESGELRKPAKEVSINVHAVAAQAGVDDVKSMTIQESRKLGVALTNVFQTAD